MNATFLATTCNDTAWSQGQAFWDALGQRQEELERAHQPFASPVISARNSAHTRS